MRRRYVALAAVFVVLGACGTVAWRWNQRGPGRASVSEAISRFRSSTTAGTLTSVLVPRQGVYVYRATGHESLSFMDTRQTQGPISPGTVVLLPDGCWQFRIDFNSFHRQTWTRCATGKKLLEPRGTTDQRFDFVAFGAREHSEIACEPPIVVADLTARAGATSPVRCTGRSQTTKAAFTQSGTATFVGRETVAVGDARVPAVHTREDMTLRGGQTGEVRVDIWFATADGLPLKEAHSIRVVSPAPAPLNRVTYTERGSWQLTSRAPRL